MGLTGDACDFFAGLGAFRHKSQIHTCDSIVESLFQLYICKDPDAWSNDALPFSFTKTYRLALTNSSSSLIILFVIPRQDTNFPFLLSNCFLDDILLTIFVYSGESFKIGS